MKPTTRTKRRVAAVAASIGLVAASAPIAANITSAASGDDLALPPSTFEIDEDANLTQDDPDPGDDWGTVNETIGIDEPTGRDDDSYVGGTKEDTECPDETTGSIPNNKSDLLTFHAYREPGDPGFFNLAWSRVSDPSGTTLMDIEFNQSNVACPQGPNLVRTPGDLLIEYGIGQGGKIATLLAREWTGTEWGPQEDISSPRPECGNQPCAVGTINQTTIAQADSFELNAEKQPRTFGEAQIDLDYIFDDAKCISFGAATLKSRSSDSFTSQLKDFISPIPINLRNCGSVRIEKQTDPDGALELFDFTSDILTDPADGLQAFSLADDESISNSSVLFGDYTLAEGTPPTGWQFVSVDCSASSGVAVDTSLAPEISFTIDDAADSVDCTFYNEAKASLTFVKDANFDGVSFDYTGSNVANFSLANGDSVTYSDLAPGTYGATETVPPGWVLESQACDNGDSADAVTLSAGDDVTCTFVNRIRGAITIEKVAERDGVLFDFTSDIPGLATFQLANGDSNGNTALPAGTYGSAETVPAGWNLVSATCDNGDPTSGVVIDQPGETVTCTYVNEIQTGAIAIQKTRKHAAAGGDDPHAGVTFDITNSNNATSLVVQTDANGYACVEGLPVSILDGSYTVTETVPGGYVSDNAQQFVDVVEGTCESVSALTFVNIPLTDVTISVDSQVPGGTASVMECTSAQGTVSASTDENGEGSLTVSNLRPTDPEITITCTVVIDP